MSPRRQRPTTRRTVLAALGTGLAAGLAAPRLAAQAAPVVVVVGGGFAGAKAARMLHRLGLSVTLVQPGSDYVACPMSNAAIVGLRPPEAQVFGWGGLESEGVTRLRQPARAVDAAARQVILADGRVLPYDRLVLAPGIDMAFGALPGYGEAEAELLPHAWKAGPQTWLLQRQLKALEDGGLVVMAVPANPYRCPPGPYERASLIASWLQRHRPRSKLLVLDAKDSFSKQKLFQEAWGQLYPGRVEWVGLSGGGNVIEVKAGERRLVTEFGDHVGAVVNVIPPQRAGAIAQAAGVADRSGWCPVDPVTFESRLVPGIHVIGDAAMMGAMPKSAFAAHGQGSACALAVAALLRGAAPSTVKLVNTCWSLTSPDTAVSVSGVYQSVDGVFSEVQGAGGTSPLAATVERRRTEAVQAEAWFRGVTGDVFG